MNIVTFNKSSNKITKSYKLKLIHFKLNKKLIYLIGLGYIIHRHEPRLFSLVRTTHQKC